MPVPMLLNRLFLIICLKMIIGYMGYSFCDIQNSFQHLLQIKCFILKCYWKMKNTRSIQCETSPSLHYLMSIYKFCNILFSLNLIISCSLTYLIFNLVRKVYAVSITESFGQSGCDICHPHWSLIELIWLARQAFPLALLATLCVSLKKLHTWSKRIHTHLQDHCHKPRSTSNSLVRPQTNPLDTWWDLKLRSYCTILEVFFPSTTKKLKQKQNQAILTE